MNEAIRGGLALALIAAVVVAVGYGEDIAAERGLGFATLMIGAIVVAIGLIRGPARED